MNSNANPSPKSRVMPFAILAAFIVLAAVAGFLFSRSQSPSVFGKWEVATKRGESKQSSLLNWQIGDEIEFVSGGNAIIQGQALEYSFPDSSHLKLAFPLFGNLIYEYSLKDNVMTWRDGIVTLTLKPYQELALTPANLIGDWVAVKWGNDSCVVAIAGALDSSPPAKIRFSEGNALSLFGKEDESGLAWAGQFKLSQDVLQISAQRRVSNTDQATSKNPGLEVTGLIFGAAKDKIEGQCRVKRTNAKLALGVDNGNKSINYRHATELELANNAQRAVEKTAAAAKQMAVAATSTAKAKTAEATSTAEWTLYFARATAEYKAAEATRVAQVATDQVVKNTAVALQTRAVQYTVEALQTADTKLSRKPSFTVIDQIREDLGGRRNPYVAYGVGLADYDTIFKIGPTFINGDNFESTLSQYKPGQTLELEFGRRGVYKFAMIKLPDASQYEAGNLLGVHVVKLSADPNQATDPGPINSPVPSAEKTAVAATQLAPAAKATANPPTQVASIATPDALSISRNKASGILLRPEDVDMSELRMLFPRDSIENLNRSNEWFWVSSSYEPKDGSNRPLRIHSRVEVFKDSKDAHLRIVDSLKEWSKNTSSSAATYNEAECLGLGEECTKVNVQYVDRSNERTVWFCWRVQNAVMSLYYTDDERKFSEAQARALADKMQSRVK